MPGQKPQHGLRRTHAALFSEIDLVFFDTTSIYFEGEGGQEVGRRGKSKDSRPDLKQMVVGLVLDGHGWPLCCELWPGNTADVTTLLPVVNRLRQRFRVRRVCIVADRGMISAQTIRALESREVDCDYILGARMRAVKEVREKALADRGRYHEVTPERQRAKDPSPLKVKEVLIQNRRYVVCLNEEQRRKDAADRQAIVEHLREQLKQGDKELVGNKGYRKYLQVASAEHFTIDEAKVKAEARYDGQWVLQTNLAEGTGLLRSLSAWRVPACALPSLRSAAGHQAQGGTGQRGLFPECHRATAAWLQDDIRCRWLGANTWAGPPSPSALRAPAHGGGRCLWELGPCRVAPTHPHPRLRPLASSHPRHRS